MSDEIRVGDRRRWNKKFAYIGKGLPETLVVVGLSDDRVNYAYERADGERGEPLNRDRQSFIGMTEPSEQAAKPMTIEERRKQLKVGDAVRDIALVCAGMRLRKNYPGDEYGGPWNVDLVVRDVVTDAERTTICAVNDCSSVTTLADVWTDGRVTYLGMAGEEKAALDATVRAIRKEDERIAKKLAEVMRRFQDPASNRMIIAGEPKQPAKCRPDCTPSAPCRTEAVCPVWREAIPSDAGRLDYLLAKERDKLEANQWRSQRYEPGMNGHGALVGRYRVSRR